MCIPKEENLADCNNRAWEGEEKEAAVLSIPWKVYFQKNLYLEMRTVVDDELLEELAGCRPEDPCTEEIFTQRHICP